VDCDLLSSSDPALVGRGEGASDAVVVVLESLDDALREKCCSGGTTAMSHRAEIVIWTY
jgi:hypothetical protein